MSRPLSVVLCTFNPRREYLEQTLAGLRDQTLPQELWELVIVDNKSDSPLANQIDLSGHNNARCVREERLGQAFARCRGIQETNSELIVFVDDDNVLNPDFLEQVLRISEAHQQIGVWSGQSIGSFETPPPDWAKPHLLMLALREFSEDFTSMTKALDQPLPYGAGMSVRRKVANAFAAAYQQQSWRSFLGRQGRALMSGEDTELSLLALENGLGIGWFSRLKLKHLIPSSRLTKDYLLRLKSGSAASSFIINHFRNEDHHDLSPFRIGMRYVRHWLRLPGMNRSFQLAVLKGESDARAMIASLANSKPLAARA